MRLVGDLSATLFEPPRGYGLDSIPDTGVQALQCATFHTLDEIKGATSLEYRPGRIFLGRVGDRPIGVLDNRHIMTDARDILTVINKNKRSSAEDN